MAKLEFPRCRVIQEGPRSNAQDEDISRKSLRHLTIYVDVSKNFGRCFETAAFAVVRFPCGAKVCHGIGLANVPGQEGETIAHAWIELDGIAYDATYLTRTPASLYRENLKVSYVVEYTQSQIWRNCRKYNSFGPWDEKIKAGLEQTVKALVKLVSEIQRESARRPKKRPGSKRKRQEKK